MRLKITGESHFSDVVLGVYVFLILSSTFYLVHIYRSPIITETLYHLCVYLALISLSSEHFF